jgi:Leucine-rich repeat (LRR) protein
LPSALLRLKNLTFLSLKANQFVRLPDFWMGDLTAYAIIFFVTLFLFLSVSFFLSFFVGGIVVSLFSLVFSFLHSVPSHSSLSDLNFGHNFISVVPETIGTMTNLTRLTLENNKIVELTPAIGTSSIPLLIS